jgi:RHS repeat-associated protein
VTTINQTLHSKSTHDTTHLPRERQTRRYRPLLLVCVVVAHLTAQTAFGQCSDRNCVSPPDGLAPEISISPAGPQSFTVPSGGSQSLPVQLGLSDANGLNQSSFSVVLQTGSTSTPQTLFSWTPNSSGTYVQSNGTLMLRVGGLNRLIVTIADKVGKSTTVAADYYLSFASTDANVPIVSRVHHDHFRDTGLGAAVLTYRMPSYTSMDEERSLGLYYDTEQVDPSGFVQFDVDTRRGTAVTGISLEIVDPATGNAVTSRETWHRDPSGKQRVAAWWSMRGSPTGAYWLRADVRTHLSDGTVRLVSQTFRLLVVNQSQSRYGGGWSLAGIQQVHSISPTTESGILINDGNGILRWLSRNGSCTATQCRYYVHAGDFSEVVYDVAAQKWERTYPNGTKITFDRHGLQTAVADRFGRTTTYTWASTDNPPVWILTSVVDPAGKVTTLNYLGGGLREIVDPFNRRATFTYQAAITAFHLIRAEGPVTLEAGYDWATNRVTSFTDWNGTWNFTYDDHGTVRQMIAPTVRASGQDTRPTTTLTSLQSVTAPKSGSTQNGNWAPPLPANAVYATVADPLGHITKRALDRYGNVTEVIDHLGRKRGTTYTTDGLPDSVSNGTQTIVYSWNHRGQLLGVTVNGSVTYSASYNFGDRPDFEERDGVTVWYRYGDRGQLLESWTGPESSWRLSTTYEYDTSYRLTATNGPFGQRTEWSYANGWLNTSEIRRLQDDGTKATDSFAYDGAGRFITRQDAFGRTSTMAYDALNRPVQVSDIAQKTTRFAYTGPHLTRVTDPAGKAYTFRYNALGWLEEEGFPEDSTKRTYRYNADGQVISSTDRRGLTINTTYDTAHRPLSIANGDFVFKEVDVVKSTYEYPNENTLIAKNKESIETIQRHPRAGDVDLVKIELPASSGRRYEIETKLDEADWSPTGIDVRQYLNDVLSRTPSTIRYTFNPNPLDTTLGSTASIQDFSGRTTTFGFDSSGRHVRTVFPMGVTQSISYMMDGQVRATSYGTNATLNRDLGVEHQYDALGRMTARFTHSGTLLWGYRYDDRGQLTEYRNEKLTPPIFCPPDPDTGEQGTCEPVWVPVSTETYAYDSVGNRTDRGATMVPNSNRYKTFDGYSFEYDSEGNLTRKYDNSGFNQVFTWNALGQLTSVTTNGNKVEYGYSPTGDRVRRTQGGTSQYFLYHNGNILQELGNDGNPVHQYTHAPGLDNPLSVMKAALGPSHTYYYVIGKPGHVTYLLNTSGQIAARYRYAPFGKIEAWNTGDLQPLAFMARELDATTGLYYVRARWYDPSAARFISSDPIGLHGGINTYAYVENNPMNARDPSGLQTTPPHSCSVTPCILAPDGVCVKEGPFGWTSHPLWSTDCRGNPFIDYPNPNDDNFYDFGLAEQRRAESFCFYYPGTGGVPRDYYNSTFCRAVRHEWDQERTRRQQAADAAWRECTRQANPGSWARDTWHEVKHGLFIAGVGCAFGAAALSASGPGAGVGCAIGSLPGLAKTAHAAVWEGIVEATIDRVGNNWKHCGMIGF